MGMMMKKRLSILIFLCILAIGIAANANIEISGDDMNQSVSTLFQNANTVGSSSAKSTTDPTTVSFLLGIGIVSFVCFSRRN
jgi:hypothetical protein